MFDDKIIKNFNFQKMVQNGVPGTPLRTPSGSPMGPNILLVVDNIYLHHPQPDKGKKLPEEGHFRFNAPFSRSLVPLCTAP